jgi:hypothetical protein
VIGIGFAYSPSRIIQSKTYNQNKGAFLQWSNPWGRLSAPGVQPWQDDAFAAGASPHPATAPCASSRRACRGHSRTTARRRLARRSESTPHDDNLRSPKSHSPVCSLRPSSGRSDAASPGNRLRRVAKTLPRTRPFQMAARTVIPRHSTSLGLIRGCPHEGSLLRQCGLAVHSCSVLSPAECYGADCAPFPFAKIIENSPLSFVRSAMRVRHVAIKRVAFSN